ncbi:DNA-binding protein hexbp-like, partial [Trifolium pratense]
MERHGSSDRKTVSSGNDVSRSRASSSTSARKGRLCFCHARTILLTVKHGDNAGRQFWRCPFWMTPQKCDMFKWADEEDEAQPDVAALAL